MCDNKDERKKGDEQIFTFGFLSLVCVRKVSGIWRIDLTIEWRNDIVCMLFHSCTSFFLEVLRIPYVQAAILNLLHSYLTSTTVGSQLSEPRLSVSGHLDVGSRRHVFSTSGKKTLRSLEFCYWRKQSCCTNDFPECHSAFSMQYGI